MKHITATTTAKKTSTTARRTLTIVAASLSLAAFTGCSAITERATEKIVEESVERAVEAETGEDVEFDFDSDGNFSIETEDGSFSVDEDGSFELETEDGTYSGETDDDGYVINGEDGVIVDADFNDEDGSITFESDDGTVTAGTGDDAWELWPTEISRPDFAAEAAVSGSQLGEDALWLIATGIADGEPSTAIANYVAELDGFDEAGIDAGDNAVVLTNGSFSVSVVADPASNSPGDSILQVSVTTG